MLFSRACEHGIRAVLYLATTPEEARPVQVKDIAAAIDVPFPFLAKILQSLSRKGILKSQKGPGGGVTLSDNVDRMTLLDVVDAIDGLQDLQERCVLGLAECSSEAPCALHNDWAGIRDRLVELMGSRSIVDFARGTAPDKET